jgi:hypothetical protein
VSTKEQLSLIIFLIGIVFILDALFSLWTPAVGHFFLADSGRVLRFILGVVLLWLSQKVKEA